VPLKTLSFVAALSVVIVTTVPAGDVNVMSRSPGNVWRIAVVRSTSQITPVKPETTIVEVTVEVSGMGSGVELVKVVVAAPQGALGATAGADVVINRKAAATRMTVQERSRRVVHLAPGMSHLHPEW
jgi:hypothetical protein